MYKKKKKKKKKKSVSELKYKQARNLVNMNIIWNSKR